MRGEASYLVIHVDVKSPKTDILFTYARTHIHNDPLHMILPRRSFPNYNRYSENSMSLASGHHRIMVATQTGPS